MADAPSPPGITDPSVSRPLQIRRAQPSPPAQPTRPVLATAPDSAEGGPVQVVVGGMLGDLHVWTEEEWASLDEASRSGAAVHVEGLGWVGVVTRVSLN